MASDRAGRRRRHRRHKKATKVRKLVEAMTRAARRIRQRLADAVQVVPVRLIGGPLGGQERHVTPSALASGRLHFPVLTAEHRELLRHYMQEMPPVPSLRVVTYEARRFGFVWPFVWPDHRSDWVEWHYKEDR